MLCFRSFDRVDNRVASPRAARRLSPIQCFRRWRCAAHVEHMAHHVPAQGRGMRWSYPRPGARLPRSLRRKFRLHWRLPLRRSPKRKTPKDLDPRRFTALNHESVPHRLARPPSAHKTPAARTQRARGSIPLARNLLVHERAASGALSRLAKVTVSQTRSIQSHKEGTTSTRILQGE